MFDQDAVPGSLSQRPQSPGFARHCFSDKLEGVFAWQGRLDAHYTNLATMYLQRHRLLGIVLNLLNEANLHETFGVMAWQRFG